MLKLISTGEALRRRSSFVRTSSIPHPSRAPLLLTTSRILYLPPQQCLPQPTKILYAHYATRAHVARRALKEQRDPVQIAKKKARMKKTYLAPIKRFLKILEERKRKKEEQGRKAYLRNESQLRYSMSTTPKEVIQETKQITNLLKIGELEEAEARFKTLQESETGNAVTWATMLGYYARKGMIKKLRQQYKIMIQCKIPFSQPLFCSIINAFATNTQLEEMTWWFYEMRPRGVKPNSKIYNSLFKGFSNGSRLDQLEKFYAKMREDAVQPDQGTLSVLIWAFAKHLKPEKVAQYWKEMESLGVPITDTEYGKLLEALARMGRYQESLELLEQKLLPNYPPSLKSCSAWTAQLCSGKYLAYQTSTAKLRPRLNGLNAYYTKEIKKLGDGKNRSLTEQELKAFRDFLKDLVAVHPIQEQLPRPRSTPPKGTEWTLAVANTTAANAASKQL